MGNFDCPYIRCFNEYTGSIQYGGDETDKFMGVYRLGTVFRFAGLYWRLVFYRKGKE